MTNLTDKIINNIYTKILPGMEVFKEYLKGFVANP
jgi:hypothetical protein